MRPFESLPAARRIRRLTTVGSYTLPFLVLYCLLASAVPAVAEDWRDMLEAVLQGEKEDREEESIEPEGVEIGQEGALEDHAATPSYPDRTASSEARTDVETKDHNETTEVRSANSRFSDHAASVSERVPVAPEPVVSSPSRAIPSSADLCYQEIASIGTDSSFLKSPEFYFKHVYQYIDTPPYYQYVGPASIGIKREPKSAPMYQIIEGRKNVGKGHYALLTPYGKGVVSDVGIDVGLGRGEFAYLFFNSSLPGKPHNNTRWRRSRYNQIAGARVATTVGGDVVFFYPSELTFHSHSFYKVKSGMEWRRAESPRDRWRGERRYFKTPGSVDYLVPKTKTAVRTISTQRKKTTRIAGMDRTRKVFCRYKYSPLAFTNHEVFLPVIERELKAWVERVIKPLQHEPVVEIPKGHVGDFVQRGEYGTIAIRFSRDRERALRPRSSWKDRQNTLSWHKYFVEARLHVNGEDLGVVSEYPLGQAQGCLYCDRPFKQPWLAIKEKYERGGFSLDRLHRPGGNVPVRFDCSETKCVLEVQRWYLDKIRRYSSR